MRFFVPLLLVGGLTAGRALVAAPPQAADLPPKYAFAEPGISPDAREIAFTSGGDLWSVPVTGGDARLLVADGAYDRRPLFSPDGRQLAFVSSRTGGGDVYVLTFATGDVRRLTWDDGPDQLEAWSRDSRCHVPLSASVHKFTNVFPPAMPRDTETPGSRRSSSATTC